MLNSAKQFALKNKEKIAAGVEKATDTIDKKTNGKYHDKLEKVDGATAKLVGKPKDAAAATAADVAAPPTSAAQADA
jgi:MT0933-like antitoxin protein